jgi:hypothetical protein
MLNLNRIKETNKNKQIPKEIEETRNLITESFKDLEFVEDVHKYFLPKGKKKIELPSVSSVIKRWEQEVDWDEKAELKALSLGIPTEELKRQCFSCEEIVKIMWNSWSNVLKKNLL